MAPVPDSVTVLHQHTGGSVHTYSRINALLKRPGLKRFRAAVAYARWDGLGLIAPELEKFLGAGGEFQSIYGISNGVTTPDSFLYSLYLRELFPTHTYAGAIEDKFANATFHPKFFEFLYSDRIIAVVGSANLTGGGLVRNIELGAEIETDRVGEASKQLDEFWKQLLADALPVTLEKIRALKSSKELGSENSNDEGKGKSGKPFFNSGIKASPKPLFAKVLDVAKPAAKAKILSSLDTLTTKPKRLYLQIFETETGGQGSSKGYQVQLPTTTLATYFGVAATEHRVAKFHFPLETIKTSFTHFGNHTHRVRLKPILEMTRPGILTFDRIGPDEYNCAAVPKAKYKAVLASKCTEQARAGARRWGLE